jgi:phytoene dehydrogenase-like protein
MKVVVAGAGLAGLVCARELQKAGADVLLVEASDDAGGRVRTDDVDGFKIDRGFQVLFDAYPAVRRHLDLARLDLHPFDPGAVICVDGSQAILTDPLRDSALRDVVAAVATAILSPADKLKMLELSRRLVRERASDEEAPNEPSTGEYLRAEGFSGRAIDLFFRPFYGGIFLDRGLTTTAAAFKFYFRMLTEGHANLPAAGIGAVTRQLAEPLREAGRLRLNALIAQLRRSGDAMTGVVLEDGEEIAADAVVLAVEAPAAARLCDVAAPAGALAATAVYFAGDRAVSGSRKLYLNASPDAFVNNIQPLSNVAHSYAPSGRHLLGATVLGDPDLPDGDLQRKVWAEIQDLFSEDREARRALASYSPLCVRRVPYSQFPQPPGIQRGLPGSVSGTPGLFFAGEWTVSSSINGAMTSGERAAKAVLTPTAP